MGTCNIDHSREDVVGKFSSQKPFLPTDLADELHLFLEEEHSQNTLNELFHLLKKYDLATKPERQKRDEQITALIG